MKIYKFFSFLFFWIAPLIIGFVVFYEGQEVKTVWSFNGIIILVILFLSFYSRFKTWYKEKKQAHETARNLGQVSHSINFILLALGNYFFIAIPFVILILLEGAVKSYDGSITQAVGYLLLSIGVSQFFDVLYYQSEQKKIQQKIVNKVQQESEELVKAIKEVL